ncbi:MAG: hypothetical protein IJ752_03750 [Alphaproteobacteria bacterium]|nr:hypothetical protein [Alphaproteobacteria bacterium]
MTKSMWIAVVILALLFTACGAFMVLLQKDEEQKNIHYFLTNRKLHTVISYQEAALSVSDMVVLKNVSLRLNALPKLKNNIREFTVHSYKESGHIPVFLSFTAKDVSLRLIEAAQNLGVPAENVIDTLADFNPVEDILNAPLYAVLLAGCNDISAQIKGEYAYAPAAKKMSLKAQIDDQCLGHWTMEISFNNISNAQQGQLALAFKHFLQKGNPLKDLENFLEGASITNFSLAYTDLNLIKGYKKYIDTLYLRLPGTASPAELDARELQKVVSYLSFSNAHRQRNADIAQTLAQFIKTPGTIRFQSKPGKQVPLHVLRGTFLRRLTDLLLRLDTSVALENAEL